MTMKERSAQLQALLFSEGGAMPKKRLTQLLDIDAATLQEVARELRDALATSGLSLVESDTEYSLTVSPESSATVQKAFERDLERDIGDAGLEVLGILLYRGPSTRADIDYIRGVNTTSTIRTLSARGLIERAQNPNDAREYLYRPTVELLAHLGVTEGKDLPEYATIASELAAFEESQKKSDGPFDAHAGGESADTADA